MNLESTSIFLVFIISILLGCSAQNAPAKESTSKSISAPIAPPTNSVTQIEGVEVFNPFEYDTAFLNQISKIKQFFPLATIKDGQLKGSGGELVALPDIIGSEQELLLMGKNDSLRVKLYLKKASRTALSYQLRYGEADRYTHGGIAFLSPYFILGMESDEDDKSGEKYFTYDYGSQGPDFEMYIRHSEISNEEPLRAKVMLYSENSQFPSISLDDCPTLRAQ